MRTFKTILHIAVLIAASLSTTINASAQQFILNGTVGGKYKIVLEVDRTSNGAITGRYAYQSTLQKHGRNSLYSWLYIKPYGNTNDTYVITDANGEPIEYWNYIRLYRDGGVNHLTGRLTNARGETYNLSASSAPVTSASWAGTYRITGGVYRTGSTEGTLTLRSNGTNRYTGTLSMSVNEGYGGSLSGKVTGTVSNGILNLTLNTRNGDLDLPTGKTIARIRRYGTQHTIEPLNEMKHLLDSQVDYNSIVKIK